MSNAEPRPRLGVSSCLLGEEVRFDKGHKRDRFLTDELAPFVEFVPRCPEVAIGLGTPREPIHVVAGSGATDAVGIRSGDRVGARLRAYGRTQVALLGDLSGYVFKSRSPSCGPARVPLYRPDGRRDTAKTQGLYAHEIAAALPWLPVEDEGRLHDPGLRENFLIRVFTLHRLQRALGERPAAGALVSFHTDHKLLLMAHNVAGYRRLGRLVAGAGREPMPALALRYRDELMHSLAHPARVPHHVNVLQHVVGYLRRPLDAADRAELAQYIEEFRAGRIPWIAVRTLLRHHFRRHPDPYVARQVYFEPYPAALARSVPFPSANA